MQRLKPLKVYEQVANHIQSLIEQGVYKPGDKLPTLQEMTDLLKVGRATVREAFSALQAKGLIEIRHGEGSYVRRIDIEEFQEPMNIALLQGKDLQELLEVRKSLEVGAAELAARNRIESDLEEMRAALELMAAQPESQELGKEADLRFHRAIARASGNSMLVSLIQIIQPTMESTMDRLRAISGPSQELLMEHTAIYKAIEAQNAETARMRMFEHIVRVMQRLELYKGEQK